jgi:glycyl-tRNA synthetase
LGVYPLVSNKKEVVDKAREVYEMLKKEWTCTFDVSGSIGRRYARADEIGAYACITIDFEGLEDETVTIRHRDTTEQARIKISELKSAIHRLFDGEKLGKVGKLVD